MPSISLRWNQPFFFVKGLVERDGWMDSLMNLGFFTVKDALAERVDSE